MPGIHPVHERVDEGVAAVVLPQLPEHQRHLLRDRRRFAVPACLRGAPAEVVDVPRRGHVVEGIGGPVREPLGEACGVLDAADQNHVAGPRAANRVDQLLHPGRLERHTAAGSAVAPAAPSFGRVGVVVRKRLVEQVEHHAVVALEGRGDLTPEFRRMVAVRHRRLAERDGGPGRAPVQVQDDDQSGAVEERDEVGDRPAVVVAGVRRRDSVDAEPAGLIERHADDVRVPGCDRLHGGGIRRAIENAPPLRAGVLCSGAVDPAYPDGASG